MNDTPQHAIAALATDQLGLITHTQLKDCGLTDRQIDSGIDTIRLLAVTRGLYRMAGAPTSWHADVLAACLAGPPGCVASHATAAALWELTSQPTGRPHVTVERSRSARNPLARVHRSAVTKRDTDRVADIPCTGASRTLVDCVRAGLDGPELLRQAMHRSLVSVRSVEEAVERSPWPRHRREDQLLLSLLDDYRDGIRPGSPAEVRLIRLVQQWGYPRPQKQVEMRDSAGILIARADAGWPVTRIALEYDSLEWHGPSAWASDEARHAAVEALGWTLLHADKSDLLPGARALRDALARHWPAVRSSA